MQKWVDWLLDRFDELTEQQSNKKPSEWGEEKRELPPDTPVPGMMSYDLFPYAKEIADRGAAIDPVQFIACQKGAQTGITVSVEEVNIGYSIEHEPCPMMYITGTDQLAKDAVDVRIDPMIDYSGLRHLIVAQTKKTHGKDTGDTKSKKQFAGGFLRIASIQSPSTGRSLSVRKIFFDETDAAEGELGKEGAHIETFLKRTNGFINNRKIFFVSTPRDKENSIINTQYLMGDQRKYNVPCPKCGKMQFLKWSQFRYKHEGPVIDHESVHYECENPDCLHKIKNHDKVNFLGKGKWIPTAKPKKRRFVSYHIPAFYSPVGFLDWETICEEYVSAREALKHGDHKPFKTWVLTVLGEPWEERGEAPRHELIMLKRDDYNYERGIIPDDVLIITMGCDVQGNRIEAQIIGYGRDYKQFSINHLIFKCKKNEETGELESIDDLNSSPWKRLEAAIESEYTTLSGRIYQIQRVFIDSRYKTATVRTFCAGMNGVFPTIGEGGRKSWQYCFRTKHLKDFDVIQYNIDTHSLKDRLYSYLKKGRKEDGSYPIGSCFFPKEYNQKYFRQLVSEEKKMHRLPSGNMKTEWVKRAGFERNEILDTFCLNMAAMDSCAADVCESAGFDGIAWPQLWDYLELEKKRENS